MQASLKRKHRQVRLRLQRHWRAVAGRLDQWLPAASLQTYLVAMILLATLPIALLLTWQVAGEARSGRQSAVALLQQSAASVAQAAEQDLQASMDALTALSLMDALQQGDLPAFGQYLRQTPLRRLAQPGDVAAAVAYLVSPAAAFVTGHTLDVNGGMVMA